MAKETVYNNTLVSGAADETLTYTRYVKDESSGKSTKELLDEKVNKTDQLGTTQIADKAVTTEKLENESVTTDKLDAASVTTEKVADANITTSKLADSSVETEKINNKAVTTDKLNDGAVDGRTISEASVEKKHLANNSVATEKLQDSAITSDKIHTDAVTEEKIKDSSVSNSKLADNSIGTSKIKDGNITNEKVANNTLTLDKLDPELRKSIQAATGLPENLVEVIQDVDKEVKTLHSKDTDLQSQITDKQQHITAHDKDIELLQTRSTQMEQTINNIAATGGASVANTVAYTNTTSGLESVNAQGAIDELAAKNKSQDATISAKAEKSDVQAAVSELKEKDSALSAEIAKKANSADVSAQMQTEQTRVNDELAKKFNSENIAQELGDSEDKVMSQKAVSAKVSDLSSKSTLLETRTSMQAIEKEISVVSSDVYKLLANDIAVNKGETFSVSLLIDGAEIASRIIILANTTDDTTRIADISAFDGTDNIIVASTNISSLYLWLVDGATANGKIKTKIKSAAQLLNEEVASMKQDINTNIHQNLQKVNGIELSSGLSKFSPIEVRANETIYIGVIPAGSIISSIGVSFYINFKETGLRDYLVDNSKCPYKTPVDITSVTSIQSGLFDIHFLNYAPQDSVISESIVDKSVTNEKLSCAKSFNLINTSESALHVGYYATASVGGDIKYQTNDSYDSTQFIQLESGKTYICNTKIRFVLYLDKYHKGTRLIETPSLNELIKLNEGECGIVLTLFKTEKKEYQLEEGTSSTPYVPYNPIIPIENVDTSDIDSDIEKLISNVTGTVFKNEITTGNDFPYIQKIVDSILVKAGETFSLKLEGTASVSRFIVLCNTNQDKITNRVLDYPLYGKEYSITATEDITSLYLWAVNDVTKSGIVYTTLKFGLSSDIISIKETLEKVNFENDIVIPKNLYMLSKKESDNKVISQNDIFYREILKRWMPYDSYIFLDGLDGLEFSKRWSDVASVINPKEDSTLRVTLRDYKSLENIKMLTAKIHVGTPEVGNGDIYVMVMGDSTINGGCHRALYNYGFVPNIHCVGLRLNSDKQYDEGRGGWTLKMYSSIIIDSEESYNPYWQPKGNNVYLGSTGFWKNAWLCKKGTQPSGFEPKYSCGRYDTYVTLFDESTGYFLNPKEGYMMYDTSEETFKVYSDGSWINTTSDSYSWGHSFKYLSAFNIHIPDYFIMNLGLNDFWNKIPTASDFAEWNSMVDSLISAFHETNPNGYFILSICTVSVGCMDNEEEVGDTNMQHASMWLSKKNIIKNYDNRDKEKIFVVDSSLMVDSENAFRSTLKGVGHPLNADITATKNIQSGIPHFYNGYNAWAIPLAAFIQYTRTDK